MTFVNMEFRDGLATVRLQRGKVNALNEQVVDELSGCFRELEADPGVGGILLTGTGKFFSFGFDIPEFLDAPKEDFYRYLRKFTGLYRELFVHPRPVVAALNGHTVAGGCMLASACDVRVMVKEHARIGLNEIGFRSSVFAGSVELLRFWVGSRRAQEVLYGGALYTAEQALALGLIDAVVPEGALLAEAKGRLLELAGKSSEAFRSVKRLLRQPVAEEMQRREDASIREFVEIWYSMETRAELEKIQIRG
ncbi:MAG TPA: enoyl-CoA hydratase/isomerase family protein [Myxococcaceae bacterium]|nr:enoyl-CoA hydratase/isomerase family protein [Myxococcaceae bacterium]